MSFPFGKRPSGFTLIELLIVVAIIAILAAIAVPNFLEAQTRSKVSRAKADMRSMATALEAYRVDNNAYPNCHNFGYVFDGTPTPTLSPVLERLSTPIAYITTSLMPDPFVATARTGTINSSTGTFTPTAIVQGTTDGNGARYLKYYTPGETGLQDVDTPGDRARFCFLLSSTGPWLTHPNMGGLFAAGATDLACLSFIYDPTNGTVSRGSIFRTGGTNPPGNYGATFFRWAQSTQK